MPMPLPGVMLGATSIPNQWGILGTAGRGQTVAMDLDGCNTISLFGVQGFGKSYTLGSIVEMAVANVPRINTVREPLATVLMHYHESDAYEPEFLASIRGNDAPNDVRRLKQEYGARPSPVKDVVLLCPESKVELRRREYPGVQVFPIKFSSTELKAAGWKFLLGAYGNESLYLKQLTMLLRSRRDTLTFESILKDVKDANLSGTIQALVEHRLQLASQYIDDSAHIGDLLKPGRTIVVDMRDAWIERSEALELFVVLMMIFASAGREEGVVAGSKGDFSRLIVFDEAHKYISEGEIVSHLVAMIREMRHQATTVIIASQDPLSIPRVIIELTTILVMHRMTSPVWVKHLKSAIFSLEDMRDQELARLEPGEALVWAQKSTHKGFTEAPQRVAMRPRVSAHGGGTKTAIK